MNLRAACMAAALACTPVLVYAQKTPVFQSGTIIPGDLVKGTTQGLISDVGGLAGDALGYGVNPFSIYDRGGDGLVINSATTSGAYQSLSLGHDSDGNALLSVQSHNGATDKLLNCDINGSVNPCFGISPLDSVLLPDRTVLGNISGSTAAPVAVSIDDLFPAAPSVAQSYGDDSSTVILSAEARGDERQKITLGTLLTHGRNAWLYSPSVYAQIIDAETAHDVQWGFGVGSIIWDVSHLSYNEEYTFAVSAGTVAYLDPGRTSVFHNAAPAGQMLKMGENGPEVVSIRRLSQGIFFVTSNKPSPGASPIRFLTGGDLSGGHFTLPFNAAGGMEYSNNTGGVATIDLSNMGEQTTLYVSSTFTSANSTVIDPNGGTIMGLAGGQTMTIGPGVKVAVTRQTSGIYVVGNGPASLATSVGFTRAALPLTKYNGMGVFCTNCRKPGEGAGSGTGMPVFWDASHSDWYTTAGVLSAS